VSILFVQIHSIAQTNCHLSQLDAIRKEQPDGQTNSPQTANNGILYDGCNNTTFEADNSHKGQNKGQIISIPNNNRY
jgi:hypothetical protein